MNLILKTLLKLKLSLKIVRKVTSGPKVNSSGYFPVPVNSMCTSGGKLGRYHLEQDVRSDGINTFKV